MQTDFEATYHELEEQHWWFRGRRDMLMTLIRRMRIPKHSAILDVGCSGGPLMLSLRDEGYDAVTGMDISEAGIKLAKSRGLDRVQVMDAANLEYADAQFDLLVASDVLEHIQDEAAALRCWTRVLKPGGTLIVFVPAFQSLWSEHDQVNLHYRRYTRATLRSAIHAAGLRVDRAGYWNFSLFFPVGAARLLMRNRAKPRGAKAHGQLKRTNRFVNASLFSLLRIENRISSIGLNWPVGVSTFAIATKPA